jgi:hypothetical protein
MKSAYDLFPEIDRHRNPKNFPDITEDFFWETYNKCKAYSLLGIEAFYNLYRSIEYIARHKIEGDIVECGVFLGGAVLAMSEFAWQRGLRDRAFYLYDTFAGFPPGTSEVDARGKEVAFSAHENFCDQVRQVVGLSSYPADQFQFVVGPVEQTLRQTRPEKIALLRLDTDYYESTRVELNELYPRLSSGGVLIVDDYGSFKGARRATDEYFRKEEPKMLLCRINFSVRCGVKLGEQPKFSLGRLWRRMTLQ